jgi:cell division protein FtsA
MAREDIITGIDIGSSMIRVASGQLKEREGVEPSVHIIGAAEAPAEGINKGAVTSIEDAVASISGALEKCERMTGVPIEHAVISVNGSHVISQDGHGVVAVSKANGEVAEDDIDRVIEAAQQVATPPNYEILHVIPRSFTVDDQLNIKDPLGMTGIKLEVNAQIILGMTAQIKNVTKSVYRTGVNIDDLVVEVLAAAESVLTKKQKELGVVLVNMGATTTSFMVFEEGEVLEAGVLPVGSAHITNDIAIGLRTSVDTAEEVKLQYGTASAATVGEREEINLAKIDENEEERIPRKAVAEIIEARIEEMFHMVQKKLRAIDRDGKLPAGIVLTGGGAKLDGLVDVAKVQFRMSASVGLPDNMSTPIEKIMDPAFSTAIGLVLWGDQEQQQSSVREGLKGLKEIGSIGDAKSKIGKWMKSLMP